MRKISSHKISINGKIVKVKKNGEDGVAMNKSHKLILIIFAVIFAIYSLTLVFPLLWLILNSLKSKDAFFAGNPFDLPDIGNLAISNYFEMFTKFPLAEMFFNSIELSLIIPTVCVFVTACAAYVITKFDFRGKKIIASLNIVVMFFGVSGSLASQYNLISNLNLMDTLLGMIFLTSGAFGFNCLLLMGSFKGVSNAYREAAMIDGASEARIFFQIYLPQVLPTISAIWILQFIGQWNDYQGVYLFYNSHETLSTGIKYISDNITSTEYLLDYPKLFACIIISIIPAIVLFIAFQKQIIKLNMGGGIKGLFVSCCSNHLKIIYKFKNRG